MLASCSNGSGDNKKSPGTTDTTIKISVDESFQPVIAEQVKVFEAAYPDTKVLVEYKPEAACLRDLEKDSTKIVIISRELNRDETKFYDGKFGYKPEFGQLAKDAIAVVVNNQAADSTFLIE